MAKNETITAVRGIKVGHHTVKSHHTGATVLLTENGAVAGMDIRGGAPAIARTGPLMPETLVNKVHGIALFGGSSFGLDAAGGVIRWLRERNVGFDTGHGRVPIVPAAAIFDLALNKKGIQPSLRTGYLACENAGRGPVMEGCVGAGAGASVGKFYGIKRAMKSGVGSAFAEGFGGIRVGALAVVNALGDVCDPATGKPVAGVLSKDGKSLLCARDLLYVEDRVEGFPGDNTVLSVVATDAGGVRDIVAGDRGILVASGDVNVFTERLKTLVENSLMRRTMGRSAREFVRRNFSKERLIRDTENLYKEVDFD